jgi:transcriptional regulator with XRE-family HTH domain
MDRKRIGELVRSAREAAGLSLRSAASRTGGTAFATWQQIESGRNNSTVDTLADIAGALGMVWTIDLSPQAPRDARRQLLADRLVRVIDRLDERDLRLLSGQVDAYERELGLHGQSAT